MNERYETISLAWECADCKAPLFADGEALKVHGDWHCRACYDAHENSGVRKLDEECREKWN